MSRIASLRRMRLASFAQAAPPAGAAKPELTVSELKAYPLREPVSRRAYTVLEIRTRGGLTGYGECAAATEPVLEAARQAVTGQPATSYEVISRRLAESPAMQAAVVMTLLDIVG